MQLKVNVEERNGKWTTLKAGVGIGTGFGTGIGIGGYRCMLNVFNGILWKMD